MLPFARGPGHQIPDVLGRCPHSSYLRTGLGLRFCYLFSVEFGGILYFLLRGLGLYAKQSVVLLGLK